MRRVAGTGGYAEYAAVSERNVAHIPANLSYEQAAAVPLAGLTALQALRDQAQLRPGAHILINGASGGVGSFAVQIARALSARVTAACSGRNAGLARDLGADAVIDYTATDITTGDVRYDVVFDAANAFPIWRWRRVLTSSGTAVSVNPGYALAPLKWLLRLSHRQLSRPDGNGLFRHFGEPRAARLSSQQPHICRQLINRLSLRGNAAGGVPMAELPTCILIDPAVTTLDEIAVPPDGLSLTLRMSATSHAARCPLCSQLASRIHSHYHRTLADLPWADVPVQIDLRVRRFFCTVPECPQRIFTERLPTVAKPWARRTQRLAQVQQQLGLVAGGSAGSTLASTLACPAGVDLLITLVRQRPLPEHPTPRVLGVDDWAMLKGQRYGTILIDHERGDIVDLLSDRTPERLAQWLRDHPGVEIVTRDRAEAYAQGIREGAPDAIQVADRWHLIKNVSDALASVFQDYRQAITKQLGPAAPSATPPGSDVDAVTGPSSSAGSTPLPADPPAVTLTPADIQRQQRALDARDLHELGWSQQEIACKLHCHPRTVRRYLRRAVPLPPRSSVRTSKLDAYKPYLLRRWNEGCHNASQLLREIQAQGFDGRYEIMRAYVASLRELSGVPARSRTATGQPLTAKAAERVPSSRMLAWMSTQDPQTLDDDQRAMVEQLCTIHPTVTLGLELGQAFAAMVRLRQADKLDGWLERAAQSQIAAFVSLAKGLRADEAAVRAGLTLEWSNGRTEGSVNRLKCVKRQMYGRGKLDLLRLRLLAA